MAGGNNKRPEPDDDAKLEPLPWERQAGDSPQVWAAFVVYRDMGPGRSLRAVCSDMGKDLKTIGRWSSRHGWRAKVEAFDREQDRITRMAMIDKAIRMGERHAGEAIEVAKGLMVYPRAVLAKLENDPTALEKLAEEDLEKLMAGLLAAGKVLPAIWQAERVSRGYSNEQPAVPSEDPDMLTSISPDEYVAKMGDVAQVLADAGKLPPEIAEMLRSDAD
jgi:hypothetical protein